MVDKTYDAPKMNVEAVSAMQKANIDTLVEARKIMLGATQSIAKLQYAWVSEALKQAETLFKGEVAKRKPEAMFAEAKAMTERAITVGKEQTDLGIKAQKEVADLVTARVQKNFEDAKTLAA